MIKYLFLTGLIFNIQILYAQSLSLEKIYGITDGRTESMHKLMYYNAGGLSFETREKKRNVLVAGLSISQIQFTSQDSIFNKITALNCSLAGKQYRYFSGNNAVYVEFGITNTAFINTKKEIISDSGKEIIRSTDKNYKIAGHFEIGIQVPFDIRYSLSVFLSNQRDIVFFNQERADRFKTSTIALGMSFSRQL